MGGLCASPAGRGGSQVSFRDLKHYTRRKMLSEKKKKGGIKGERERKSTCKKEKKKKGEGEDKDEGKERQAANVEKKREKKSAIQELARIHEKVQVVATY